MIISGEAVVSIIFNLPTTGQALIQTLIVKDTYVAATMLVMLSALLIIGNLIADLLLDVGRSAGPGPGLGGADVDSTGHRCRGGRGHRRRTTSSRSPTARSARSPRPS